MKLSVVIICWNDFKVIQDCLKSIFAEPLSFDFEVIISDNGSTDPSIPFVKEHYPRVKVVENGANLGFAKGNNAGIRAASGEYVLILNPDTIIHGKSLESFVAFAQNHPKAGAFGCRVLNRDGSDQNPARPLPTVHGYLIAALGLRFLAKFSKAFESDKYLNWDGLSEKEIGFQSGCCVMVRNELLSQLEGFDERFFYHFEETDLCFRVWKSGRSILFCPDAVITHLGGQSVGRFPVRFALETYRSRYRYFFKHYGESGARQIRLVSLVSLAIRCCGYSLINALKPREAVKNRLFCDRALLAWNWRLDPLRFIKEGAEPESGYEPLAPAPVMTEWGGICHGQRSS
ncbi:MAG TPA: glycosyltransferase family 2 protein [Verrucomicrobiae bacterium]